MRFVCLFVLFFSFLVVAQSPPRAQQTPKASKTESGRAQPQSSLSDDDDDEPESSSVSPPRPSDVPPNAAVITINGLCESTSAPVTRRTSSGSTSPTAGCKTVISRAQFERLAKTLNPSMPPSMLEQLAHTYPRLLLFAHQARQMGLDKKPIYREMMQWAALQILSTNLTHEMQEKAEEISEAEIEKYYRENRDKFERFSVLHIVIPGTKEEAGAAGPNPEPSDPTVQDETMKAEAVSIRARAAAGEDFAALQKEVFNVSGRNTTPVDVKADNLKRGDLPAAEAGVFEMKPGEISELLSDSDSYHVYKLVSKTTIPPDQARSEIHRTLHEQKIQRSVEALLNSIKPELNQAYFSEVSAKKSTEPDPN